MSTSAVEARAPSAVREALYLIRAEAKANLLSVSAAFLVWVYLFIAGAISAGLLWVDEKTSGALLKGPKELGLDPDQVIKALSEQGVNEHLAEAMVRGDLPPLVIGVLFFSTFAIPVLVLLVGYNRISEDVHTKYTRYLMQRVHRGSYLTGKIVGHWLVCFLSIVLVHVALVIYGSATDRIDAGEVMKAMPRIWLAMGLFVLAYSAFTEMVSTIVAPPSLALFAGFMLLVGLKLASWVGAIFDERVGGLWMGGWDVPLWALDPRAIAVYGGYCLIFGGTAYLVLRSRDL